MWDISKPKKLCFIYFPTGLFGNFLWMANNLCFTSQNNELLGVTKKGSALRSCSLWGHTRLLEKSVAWQHKDQVCRRLSKGKQQRIIVRMRAQRDPSISTASLTGLSAKKLMMYSIIYARYSITVTYSQILREPQDDFYKEAMNMLIHWAMQCQKNNCYIKLNKTK